MLIGGQKANEANRTTTQNGRIVGSRRKNSIRMLAPTPDLPSRILSADDEALSHKVRSMYEGGVDSDSDRRYAPESKDGRTGPNKKHVLSEDATGSPSFLSKLTGSAALRNTVDETLSNETSDTGKRNCSMIREENELAGGIEDWEDLNGGDVDRYGFIIQRRLPSIRSSTESPREVTPEPQGMHRTSTLLQIASDAPRSHHSIMRRSPSARSLAQSAKAPSTLRPDSGLRVRPTSSQSSYRSTASGHSKMRAAANRLPHNKSRRIMDEAGDMLTLPPGLADIAEGEEDNKAADDLKRKEWEREEKWRKMAKVVKTKRDGGGMVFEFDVNSPKVIERTWKGIPDRWRATAWHAFLSQSAKKRPGSPPDAELIAAFQKLVSMSSPDDVQIDIDVPRTINSHIMFRRRYRGGQRLLFRVLHCMSIYFPDTGYVQGMAALAATFLCYFDEEMTFVMLVRLWQLRGLERLYQSGFDGLMQALDEFEKEWLVKGEVAAKLVSAVLPPPAYLR